MLDIKLIRTQPDAVRKAFGDRGGRSLPALEELLVADGELRAVQKELEPLQARRNKAADEVGRLKREKQDASALLKEMESVKASIKALEEKDSVLKARVDEILAGLPNIPDASVPVGKDAAQNKVVREGTIGLYAFAFEPRDHQEVGEKLGILDFARASKLSGARFSLLVGMGARLERALIQFMLDFHTEKNGYTELLPPYLVTRQTMTGTGQLPKFSEELYATQDDLFLIPTAEVPVTNIYRDETLNEADLPKSFCAYTACFRREAGSYGKDTRGLIRNHQFNKVELVRFVKPENHLDELEKLTEHARKILETLGLPHRVVSLVTGDIGFSSAKTYDLEVWMPGDRSADPKKPGAWREISSCSTFTDFQARRINIRMKRRDGSKGFVHTLNGSGVAIGRAMAAILENYQRADGTVAVPEALRPYLGGIDTLVPQPPL